MFVDLPLLTFPIWRLHFPPKSSIYFPLRVSLISCFFFSKNLRGWTYYWTHLQPLITAAFWIWSNYFPPAAFETACAAPEESKEEQVSPMALIIRLIPGRRVWFFYGLMWWCFSALICCSFWIDVNVVYQTLTHCHRCLCWLNIDTKDLMFLVPSVIPATTVSLWSSV